MESELVVDGFKYFEKEYGIILTRFIADGDSSTYKCLKDSFPTRNIVKIECRNHLLRNFRTKMLNIVKNTKFPIRYRKILSNEIKRMTIAIHGAIKYRKKESISLNQKIYNLRRDIKNIPNHIFGDHMNCSSYFCKKENTKLSTLNLVPEMKKNQIFEEIVSNLDRLSYHASSLLHDVDSNSAEQYNSVVCKFNGRLLSV